MTQHDANGNPVPSEIWPPPISEAAYGNTDFNTSGTLTTVPAEIAAFKWNWGAFALSWLWCFNHRLRYWGIATLGMSFLCLIPGVNFIAPFFLIGFQVYLGLNGHQLAWKSRRFEGEVAQYLQVQRAWMDWGIRYLILFVAIPVVILIVLFSKSIKMY